MNRKYLPGGRERGRRWRKRKAVEMKAALKGRMTRKQLAKRLGISGGAIIGVKTCLAKSVPVYGWREGDEYYYQLQNHADCGTIGER